MIEEGASGGVEVLSYGNVTNTQKDWNCRTTKKPTDHARPGEETLCTVLASLQPKGAQLCKLAFYLVTFFLVVQKH